MNSISNYISEKIRNIAGAYINPATEETLQSISQKKIGDSFWLKNVLSAITRLTVDASGQLRAVVSGTVAVTTLTTGNIGIGDSGKVAPKIETKYIESTREIVRIEKVPIPQQDNKALANIIIKGLKELSKTLSTIMVKGLIEIKNKK